MYSGGSINKKDNTLQFASQDGSKRDIPIEQVSDIYFMSEITFNTQLFTFLSHHGIAAHFYNYYSFYTGSFYPKEHLLSGQMLVKQVQHYLDTAKRLDIAQRIIRAASANIYRNLRYYNSRSCDFSAAMKIIESLRKSILNTKTIDELMGIEGNIRKIYYDCWPLIINQKLDFDRRVKHPPDNEINSLISYVNSLIYSKCLSEVYKTQLDPTISFLHEPGVRRYSLCLDISEIFKPLLGDRLIFSMLNRNQISEKSFTKDLNMLHLTKSASQTIVANLEERLNTTIRHRELGKNVSYQYLIRLELYKLIKHLLGEKAYEGFEIWW